MSKPKTKTPISRTARATKPNGAISPRTARRLRNTIAELKVRCNELHHQTIDLKRQNLTMTANECGGICATQAVPIANPVNRWDDLAQRLTAIHQKILATHARAYSLRSKLIGPMPATPPIDLKEEPGAIPEYLRHCAYIDDTIDGIDNLLESLLN